MYVSGGRRPPVSLPAGRPPPPQDPLPGSSKPLFLMTQRLLEASKLLFFFLDSAHNGSLQTAVLVDPTLPGGFKPQAIVFVDPAPTGSLQTNFSGSPPNHHVHKLNAKMFSLTTVAKATLPGNPGKFL